MMKYRLALLCALVFALTLSTPVPHTFSLDITEPGFPIMITPSTGIDSGGPGTNVLAANIDADPALEIVLPIQSGGPLMAWNADTSPVSGWPVEGPASMGMSAAGNLSQPLPGMEVVTVYRLQNNESQLYAYSSFGDTLPGFPIILPAIVATAPVLADVDSNGLDEIFIGSSDGQVYAYDASGTTLAGWPVALAGVNAGTPVIVDLDNNGSLDIVVTSREPDQLPTAYLHAFRFADQQPLSGFPVSFRPDTATGYPVVGDVDGDGELEIVVGGENYPPRYPVVRVFSRSGVLERAMRHPDIHAQTSSAPALADLDGDNIPEILAQSRGGISVWRGDGTSFPGWPVQSGEWHLNSAPIVGDVTGDHAPEVIVAAQRGGDCARGDLWVYDRDGQLLSEFPKFLNIGSTGVPAISDIDLDGRNEIVVTSNVRCYPYTATAPKVWAFDLGGPASGAVQWGQFHNGTRHNAVYTPIPTFVDLALSITDDPDPVLATSTTIYSLRVTNLGSGIARNVQIHNTLPDGSTLLQTTPSQGSCEEEGGILNCDLGEVFSGGEAAVELAVSYPQGGTITNTASVETDQPETSLSNNVASQSTTVLPAADLSLSMIANAQRFTEGDTVVYTLTVSNNGPNEATGVIVVDKLPTGLTFVSSIPSQGSYDPVSGIWTAGTLANAQGATLSLSATVNNGLGTTAKNNTATVTSAAPADPNLTNNNAAVQINIDVADLGVTLVTDQSAPLENADVTYTITVRSFGTGLATGVSLSSLLPAELTYVSSTPAQGTYDSSSGIWTIGTINSGDSFTLALVGRVNPGTSGQIIAHQASILSSDQVDRVSSNNQRSVSITVNGVDIQVSSQILPNLVSEGETFTYTVNISSINPNSASGVSVTIDLPEGITLASNSASQGSYDQATGLWQIDSLEAGATATLIMDGSINSGTAGQILLFAASLAGVDQPDIVPSNNSMTRSLAVRGADLRVGTTVSNAIPKEGNTINLTVTVRNTGPTTTTGVIVNDLLPVGLTYVSHSTNRGTYTPATGDWVVGNMTNGQNFTLTIVVTVTSGTSGTIITNTAQVTASSLGDPISSNNSASVNIGVGGVDLALAMSVDRTNPQEGENIVYTLVVDTVGNDPATNVVVEDILPAELMYVSSNATAGNYESSTGRWIIPSVPGTGTVTLEIAAEIDAGTTGVVIGNSAQIISSDQYDPNTANDASSVAITVGLIDLALSLSVNDSTPDPGANITYTITVTNNSAYTVSGIEVTDVLPEGLSFISASGDYDAQTGIWTLGTLTGGTNASLNLTAIVDNGFYGVQIYNTTSISASNAPDPNPTNDIKTISIHVNDVELILSLSDSADPVLLDEAFDYIITIDNQGTMGAIDTIVTNTLSPNVVLLSAIASQGGGCISSALIVTCPLGMLDVNSTATITINVKPITGFTGVLTHSASVGVHPFGDTAASNTDTETTGVTSLIVNTTDDLNDGICTASHCSLREAILNANAMSGLNTIRFDIPGPAPHLIEPNSLLPQITSPVILDGFSEPDYVGEPVILLSGTKMSNTVAVNHGLYITAGDSTVRGFSIGRWGGEAIYLTLNGGNTIQGNYIGIRPDGVSGFGNNRSGIYVGAPNNIIGGTDISQRNVLVHSGSYTINVYRPGNIIKGNYIGLRADGVAQGTANGGINISHDNNVFGGAEPGARNVVVGTITNPAVNISGSYNVIHGNYIGTDPSGLEEIGNDGGSIYVYGGYNLIGGTEPGEGNLIVRSDYGIRIEGFSASIPLHNIVQGNIIGLNLTGTQIMGHGIGIVVNGSSNLIGGTEPGARNVIASSVNEGIDVNGYDNVVQGNFVGTDVSGTVALGNRYGIRVQGTGNLIGGTTATARNLISGNRSGGVWISGLRTFDNFIQGNFIGTDFSGVNPLGNGASGGFRVTNTLDQYPLSSNFIGGTEPGASNRIAHNAGPGVYVENYYTSVSVLANEIYSNSGIGIDIAPGTGVTLNDIGDPDIGPNEQQNFPVITSVSYAGSTLTVSGTLDSTLNTDFRVEFFSNEICDASGYGEGKRFVGATTVSIDESSPASFAASFDNIALIGQYVSATATNPKHQTSEFSECVGLEGADLGLVMSSSHQAANENDTVSYTLTLTNYGPGNATGIEVQALLPADLLYQLDNSDGTYIHTSGEWRVDSLALNATASLTITVVVDAGSAGNTIIFPAAITVVSGIDWNSSNNQADVSLPVGIADLNLLHEVDSLAPNEGDTITYYVVLNNSGPSDASGIVVSNPLPSGVTFVNKLMTQGSYNEVTGEWIAGSLPRDGQAALTVIVTINAGTQGSTLTHSASITAADQSDPDASNNSDGASIQVGFADIGLQSTVDNAVPITGEQINLTVIVTNNGPSHATHLLVQSQLPDGIDADNNSTSAGTYEPESGMWLISGLTPGDQAVLTLTGTIKPESGGSTLSSTTRLVQHDQIDLNTTNDLVNVAINVQAETDLAVTSSFNPAVAFPSSNIIMSVTVSNYGTLTAEDVAVQVAMPESLDFVSASASHGLYDHQIGIWSIDSLDTGAVVTLDVTVNIQTGTVARTLSSTATILSASIGDLNTSNNSAVGSISVQAIPTVPDQLLPASGTTSNNLQQVFTWSQPSDAVGYEFQLGPDNPPTSTVYSGSANSYKPAVPLLAMTYYWRVRSVNADGNYSAWSDVWSVQITSLSSAAPERNMVTTATPTLSWGRISWAVGYEIEVDNNANFRSPEFEDDTLGPNYYSVTTDPLTNGKFYWRVRAKRVDGTWGNWSKPDSFVISSN